MNTTKLLSAILAITGAILILCGALSIDRVFAQDDVFPSTITGMVVNADGPVGGAIVQIQGRPEQFLTDANGVFTIDTMNGAPPVTVTAWSAGHYNGWTVLEDLQALENLTITLNPLPEDDNSEYEWFEAEGMEGSAACGLCHREYPEWQADQHSQSAVNPRFLSVYNGTDIDGNYGQVITLGLNGMPRPIDPDRPYYGPGFKLDNPTRAGNCATCHTPLASTTPIQQNCAWAGCHTSLTIERAGELIGNPPRPPQALHGDAAEGIPCEFCHKIGEVYIDEESGMPNPDRPGILSYRLFRPFDESQEVFFGPLVDVVGTDSYSPVQSSSEVCAGCHFGVFGGVVGMETVAGGTVVYNSYGEWLESPYSDPETGKTCQDCHMPPSEYNWFVFEERGGVKRDYVTLHNHTMLGASDEALLQNSVSMVTTAQRTGDQIEVLVDITNDQAGHHVPTDSPLRSMILVVEAFDADGERLILYEGPVNPDYSGDLGGLPGKTFAKVLQDDWTGEAPTSSFWRPTTLLEDSRLPAFATDSTRYLFQTAGDAEVTVEVRLLFRRAFYELMQQKGWNDPDILMEQETLLVPSD